METSHVVAEFMANDNVNISREQVGAIDINVLGKQTDDVSQDNDDSFQLVTTSTSNDGLSTEVNSNLVVKHVADIKSSKDDIAHSGKEKLQLNSTTAFSAEAAPTRSASTFNVVRLAPISITSLV